MFSFAFSFQNQLTLFVWKDVNLKRESAENHIRKRSMNLLCLVREQVRVKHLLRRWHEPNRI